MKTHFAFITRANESDPLDDLGKTACGLDYTESELSDNWKDVDCKNCLKAKESYLNMFSNETSH